MFITDMVDTREHGCPSGFVLSRASASPHFMQMDTIQQPLHTPVVGDVMDACFPSGGLPV